MQIRPVQERLFLPVPDSPANQQALVQALVSALQDVGHAVNTLANEVEQLHAAVSALDARVSALEP